MDKKIRPTIDITTEETYNLKSSEEPRTAKPKYWKCGAMATPPVNDVIVRLRKMKEEEKQNG